MNAQTANDLNTNQQNITVLNAQLYCICNKGKNMNFRSKIIIVLALSLTSNLIIAGSITDTYTAGDTLTAAKMDNIKAAVNDNNNRLSNGAVSISYKSFTVEGQTDAQVTAIVPNAATVTKAQADCIYLKFNASTYGYFDTVATATNGSCDLNAGIQIPHGVTLSSFSCTIYDNHVTLGSNISANLNRVNLNTGARQAVYSTAVSVDSTSVQILNDANGVVDTVGANIIDNSVYAYFIDVNFGANSFAAVGNFVRLYGCRMSY